MAGVIFRMAASSSPWRGWSQVRLTIKRRVGCPRALNTASRASRAPFTCCPAQGAWFLTVPAALLGLILGDLSRQRGGLILCVVVLALAALRLFVGGGIL